MLDRVLPVSIELLLFHFLITLGFVLDRKHFGGDAVEIQIGPDMKEVGFKPESYNVVESCK